MTLRAKGARKRRGSSPRRKEEGTVKVCPEVGRERRLMYGHLGAPARAAVNRERRAPAAGSRAFIKDAGRRFAAIPHIRPGHADLAARGTCPADPRRAPTSREGSAMVERLSALMWRCVNTGLPSSTVMVKRCCAPSWRVAHHLSPQEGPGQTGQASAGRGRGQAASCGVRHAQAPAALQPLTSPRRPGEDWVLTSHGMPRWRMSGGSLADDG